NATINIGKNSDELSTEEPYITGGLYGIYRLNGAMNFYNGRLRGYTGGYNGDFNSVRAKMDIISESEQTEEWQLGKTITTTNVSSEAVSNYAKSGNGYARITYIGENKDVCTNGEVYDFGYTGNEQIFTAPCEGEYSLEIWGAQGGQALCNGSVCGTPGYGGYSYGQITLNTNEVLYINVGGQGGTGSLSACATGGYNGGGTGTNDGGGCGTPYDNEASGGGGGATHIATLPGLLSSLENSKTSVIIVAGGGGGSSWTRVPGSGGGYYGGTTTETSGKVATILGGYAFGQGQNGTGQKQNTTSTTSNDGVAGGGGGYYGGYVNDVINQAAGGGGSGYTDNTRLTNTIMYGYNVRATHENWISNYLVEKDAYLQVGDETFNSINDAVAAIETEGTIIVLKASDVNDASTIPAEKNITLDLNGYELTMTQAITNQGTLTITDSSAELTGLINNIKTNVVVNQGNLVVEKTTIKSAASAINGNSGTGTITIKDNATVQGTNGVYVSTAQ
ncbi:MAG: hypothetical protein IJ341_12380, partial [Bacteroidales bacterium]|nr:hypothetical protein [Bacteroidales bacterium]